MQLDYIEVENSELDLVKIKDNQSQLNSFEKYIGHNTILFLKRQLGNGSFGSVFQGFNLKRGQTLAVKVEENRVISTLYHESKIYKCLAGGDGIPKAYWFENNENFNLLAMEELGFSLEDCFNLCGRVFSLKTTLMIALQIIDRLEFVHSRFYIHRDLKPENFLIGLNCIKQNSSKIHLTDFGLSKKYRSLKTGRHLSYKDGKEMVGTARFCSVNAHLGIELSRRDDLESLCYILIYFLKGALPWQKMNGYSKRERYENVKEKKCETSPEELCKNLPSEILTFLKYSRNLSFDEKPDYKYIKSLFTDIAKQNTIDINNHFDWNSLNLKKLGLVKKSLKSHQSQSCDSIIVNFDVGDQSS